MTLTLLLDLDNTLLHNAMGDFIPAYFQSLSNHMAALIEPNRLIECLIHATRHMIAHDSPDRTLQEVFDDSFFPGIGVPPEAFYPAAEDFYRQGYTGLKHLTHPLPEAIQMVETALGRGDRVAITTNPLYPRIAIGQRLDWAGLPADHFPFALVSSFETFHFAKPNPAFFAEALARLGWPKGPVVVVGDDPDNDILPARTLGIPTYWVDQDGNNGHADIAEPGAGGKLENVLDWIDRTAADLPEVQPKSPQGLRASLKAAPAALSSMTSGCSSEGWQAKPSAGEWSLTAVLCHLRDVEQEVNFPRVQAILSQNNPFLPAEDTDTWAEVRSYESQDGQRAMKDFLQARMRTLQLLDSLSKDDWQRPARHMIFGPTSLLETVQIFAGHDRIHLRQAHNLVAAI